MVLISKDRVHFKGSKTEIIRDFCMLSATMQKHYGFTLFDMKRILEITNADFECKTGSGAEDAEETISFTLTRGRGIFDL